MAAHIRERTEGEQLKEGEGLAYSRNVGIGLEAVMLLDSRQTPLRETSLSAYFTNRLRHYAQSLRPPPQDDTCWYLGNLLERFGRSEQLFVTEEGQMTLRPLALLYGDALQASSERERCQHLQKLGDMALFLGALFPERFARHGLHKDYFIGMGGNAYDYLADNARHNRHIFAELARTFARMLEMVANACSRNQPVSAGDILALYQKWTDTGDALARRQLESLGINLAGSERLQ